MTAIAMFVRMTAIFFALPFFGDHPVSPQIRVLLSLACTIFFFPLVTDHYGKITSLEPLSIVLLLGKEIIVGISLGWLARIIFDGLVMAASIVGFQMGFGMSNLLLPGSDAQINSFTALHRLIVILFFLSLNFHQIYIEAAFRSFSIVPLGSLTFSPEWFKHIVSQSSYIFEIAIQLAAPILIALLFAMASLGLIARTVPQMNVFTMSFPLGFFIGLATYAVASPFFPSWLKRYYLTQGESLIRGLIHLGS